MLLNVRLFNRKRDAAPTVSVERTPFTLLVESVDFAREACGSETPG